MQSQSLMKRTCFCQTSGAPASRYQRSSSHLARAMTPRRGYDFEEDSIFGSNYAASSKFPTQLEPLDIRLPNGVLMESEDFFTDIEEWVDFGDKLRSQQRCEELSEMKKTVLQAICQKTGLSWQGGRQNLINRILENESAHPNAEAAVSTDLLMTVSSFRA